MQENEMSTNYPRKPVRSDAFWFGLGCDISGLMIASSRHESIIGSLEHVLITEERWHSTTEGCIISSKDELDSYIIDHYGCGEEETSVEEVVAQGESLRDRYDNYVEHIKEGYRILFKCIDNIDEETAEILNSLAEGNNDFVILEKN